MRCSLLVSAFAFLACSTVGSSAYALGPVDLEVAGIGGYSTNELVGEIGGRAGVSFFGVYAGFRGQYFPGSTLSAGAATPFSYRQYALGGEVGWGYRFRLLTGVSPSDLVIRPVVGFGDATYQDTFHYPAAPAPPPNGTVTSTYTQPYVQPGVLIQLGLGHLILGLEGSAYLPTTEASQSSFVLEGQIGFRL